MQYTRVRKIFLPSFFSCLLIYVEFLNIEKKVQFN